VLQIKNSYNTNNSKKHYNKIANFYDNLSTYYDKKWWYNNPDSRHIKFYVSEIIYSNILSGKKVLDVGCGTCDTAIKLALKNCNVVGLDISSNMLLVALNKISKNEISQISLFKGNVEELPFINNQFDCIISEFTLNYVNNPNKAIREMLRVLKKDGKLFLVISNLKPIYIIFWEFLIGNWKFIREIKKRKGEISFPYSNVKAKFRRFSFNELKDIIDNLPILTKKIIGTHSISGFIAYPLLILELFINNLKNKKFDFNDVDHFIKIKGEKIVYNIFKKGEKIDKYFNKIGRDIIFIGTKI